MAAERLVVDANVAITAALTVGSLDALGAREVVAPPLLWPEVRSALHVMASRGLVTREAADAARRLTEQAVTERRHRSLGERAWTIADDLGWAKTYDAEYLALSVLLDAPLVTFDARVRRAAERLGVLAELNI